MADWVDDDQHRRALSWAYAISVLRDHRADPEVLAVVMHEATWYVPLRERQPPIEDLRFWSEGARAAADHGELRREHVTPRLVAKRRLALAMDFREREQILASLAVCVVTGAEHDQLSRLMGGDGWERYQAARLRVWDGRNGRWLW